MTVTPTAARPDSGLSRTEPAPASRALTGTLSSPIVAALESTWAAIQQLHPEIPDVVIVLASGSIGMPRGVLRLGHFAAMRWHHTHTHTAARQRIPEVFVGGEGLGRGAVAVLGTLLHEATHALANVRGVQDCSRQGRYHNRRFQTLASEMGLDVRQVPVIGWSDTHVPDATVDEYAEQVDHLAAALVLHRYAEGSPEATSASGDGENDDNEDPDGAEPAAKATSSAHCACPRRITVARRFLALGPITCSVCGEDFTHGA